MFSIRVQSIRFHHSEKFATVLSRANSIIILLVKLALESVLRQRIPIR